MLKTDYYIPPTEMDVLIYEKLLPQDHYLRQVKAVIDFEPLRALVSDRYSPAQGRGAEDPVRLLKLHLLAFHYDLSDRDVLREAGQCGLPLLFRFIAGEPFTRVQFLIPISHAVGRPALSASLPRKRASSPRERSGQRSPALERRHACDCRHCHPFHAAAARANARAITGSRRKFCGPRGRGASATGGRDSTNHRRSERRAALVGARGAPARNRRLGG